MDEGTESAERIQALLDERLKVMQWIDKLNAATGDIPEDVRERVKSDYQTRLDGVAAELQNYTSELQDSLLENQHEREHLGGQEKSAEARLAEAKLRHAVGEFGEDQWAQLNAEISGELTSVRGRVQVADAEITKLEEVLALIRQKPPSTQIRQAIPMVEPPPPPPSAPAIPPPDPKPLVAPPQSDELDFINSVTDAPGAVKVTHQTPSQTPPSPAPPPPPMATPMPQPDAPNAEAAASGPQKTLKCGECGVMNFPTEWYCERCGAELAAL